VPMGNSFKFDGLHSFSPVFKGCAGLPAIFARFQKVGSERKS